MSENCFLQKMLERSERCPKNEDMAEIVKITNKKNITDEEKKDAINVILDRLFMKVKTSSVPEVMDEDLKMVSDGLFNYIIKGIKKPLIQNLIDIGKYPMAGVMFLSPWLDYFGFDDSSENW